MTLGMGIWGMLTKNRKYFTMYKNVLYNIKKIKNMWGAIFEHKTLSMYLKKKEQKKK